MHSVLSEWVSSLVNTFYFTLTLRKKNKNYPATLYQQVKVSGVLLAKIKIIHIDLELAISKANRLSLKASGNSPSKVNFDSLPVLLMVDNLWIICF